MTVKELARLISAYRWLERERVCEVRLKANANVAHIDAEIEAVFLKIAQFPAKDAAVSCAQIDFLVTTLAEDEHAAPIRIVLKEAVLAHVRLLVRTSSDQTVSPLAIH